MKKALAIMATVVTVAATTMTAPAEARGWGHHGFVGPGLAFGLVAGALTAGAIAASEPYYYEPDYGYYYGPRYYYGSGPYAYSYYGGPYYRRHHYYYRNYW